MLTKNSSKKKLLPKPPKKILLKNKIQTISQRIPKILKISNALLRGQKFFKSFDMIIYFFFFYYVLGKTWCFVDVVWWCWQNYTWNDQTSWRCQYLYCWWVLYNIWKLFSIGKYLSEAPIFATTNPKYDNRLFIELRVQYMKTTSSEHVV